MFKCQNNSCKKQVGSNQPINWITVETREKTYENYVYKYGKKTTRTRVNKGWEIAKELAVCPECYVEMTGLEPTMKIKVEVFENKPKFKPTQEVRKKKWTNSNKKPVVQVVKHINKN